MDAHSAAEKLLMFPASAGDSCFRFKKKLKQQSETTVKSPNWQITNQIIGCGKCFPTGSMDLSHSGQMMSLIFIHGN